MEVVKFDKDKHYTMVCDWWMAHEGWKPVDKVLLPSTGFIVEDEEDSYAAGWLYFSVDTPVAWFDWVISNPKSDKTKRSAALDLLLKEVTACTDANNVKVTFHMSDLSPWIGRVKDNGFQHAGDSTLLARIKES